MSIDKAVEASQTNDSTKGNMLVDAMDAAFEETVEEPTPEDSTPEPELEPEEPEVEAASEIVTEEEDPVPPPSLSTKANERFQQLANERKAEKERADALEAKLEALTQTMGRTAEIQERQLSLQEKYREEQYRAQEPELLRRKMMSAGLDPANPADRQRFEQAVAIEELKMEIENLRETNRQQADSQAVKDYLASVENLLREELKGYDIDKDVFAEIVEETVIEGATKKVQATKAAKAKAARLKKVARKKAVKKPQGEQKQVLESIASSGRTGGSKVSKSSKEKPKGFSDFIDDLFRG